MDSNSIIEGSVKFRDGKKWKSRWCVMSKLSPVADCLHLQLYRDSKDRYKHGLTKASLSLQHFLGLESGFTLDKESNTIAIICQDVIVVLAFDTRERLIQWQVKIFGNLPEGQQYLIQISSSPSKAKINNGPARLHIQDGKFCMTTGVPPKLAGFWELKHLRRFGVVDGKFCFESGSLCGKGEGAYVLLTDQGDEISRSIQLASEGRLEIKRKPLMRNATVHDSPGHKPVNLSTDNNRLSDISCADSCLHNNIRSNNSGRRSQLTEDIPWPSVEMQSELFGHGDTSSLGDLTADCPGHRGSNMWLSERTLGRCSSCIGKLGIPSRPSTAANTPASVTFNPIWITDDNKSTSCFNTIMNEEFLQNAVMVSHRRNCTTTTTTTKLNNTIIDKCEMSQSLHCHYSEVDNFNQDTTVIAASSGQTSTIPQPRKPSSLSFRSASQSPPRPPPGRPPKPPKYKTPATECSSNSKLTSKKINKPPMPLPPDEKTCSCKHQNNIAVHDVLKSCPVIPFYTSTQNTNVLNSPHHYDIPRNVKILDNRFPSLANYDIPPPAVPVVNTCKCIPSKPKTIAEPCCCSDKYDKNEICVLHNAAACSLRCRQHWIEVVPSQLNPLLKYNLLPLSSKVPPSRFEPVRLCSSRRIIPKTEFSDDHSCPSSSNSTIPVYATVDLSKKINRRNNALMNTSMTIDERSSPATANSDYTNIRFTDEQDNYRRMQNLSYMNLEFTNSFKYYENVKELLHRINHNGDNNPIADDKRIEGLNIDLGNRLESELCSSLRQPVHICTKCGHSSLVACSSKLPSAATDDGDHSTINNNRSSPRKTNNNNSYVTMSPLNVRRTNQKCLTKSASNPNISSTAEKEEQASTTKTNRCRKNSEAINHKYLENGDVVDDDNDRVSGDRNCCSESNSFDEKELNDNDDVERNNNRNQLIDVERKSSSSVTEEIRSSNNVERRKDIRSASSVCNGIRRLPNIGGCSSKSSSSSSNRDSSSSNDSGFSTGSLKFHCQDFTDFEMPSTTAVSSKRHYSFSRKNDSAEERCLSIPRSKSSDPIKDLSFRLHNNKDSPAIPPKSSSAGAELPLCLNKQKCYKAECLSPTDTTITIPYVDCRSTSSGTSDMSDYIETLSYSSYGSSDVTDNLRVHQPAVTTLRPRSGKEYQKVDRISLLHTNISLKDNANCSQNPSPALVEQAESSSSGYSSADTVTQHR